MHDTFLEFCLLNLLNLEYLEILLAARVFLAELAESDLEPELFLNKTRINIVIKANNQNILFQTNIYSISIYNSNHKTI